MNEASEIAKIFINNLNQTESFHPDYYYEVDEALQDFELYWYFDFIIGPKKPIPEEERELFSGAPGYRISKLTGSVEIISFGELAKMRSSKYPAY